MTDAIRLGPLLLPLTVLLVFGSAGIGLFVGRRVGKRAGIDAGNALWTALLVGLLVARLAFVFEYRAIYFDSPLKILDIRDGGWNPMPGVLGAWLYALYQQTKRPHLARPLRWGLASGTVLFVIGMGFLSVQSATEEKLPALSLTSLDGETVTLSAFNGKPTVVNLWATWCPPCVREMPVLHQAQMKHPEVNVVLVNQGEDPAQVARWLEHQGLPLRNVLLDPRREASAAFRHQGYPTTLFFNAKGELVSRRLGELSAATLADHLAELTKR